MVAKANLKTLSTSEMETFPQVATRYRGKFRIFLKTETIFAKTFILDVWQSS